MLTELNNKASAANSEASALIVHVNVNGSTNYDLIGLCNDGFIINWKEGSGDTDGNGELDSEEAGILRETSQAVYNTWGYASAGTAYTYTPRLSRSLIYYTVIRDTGGSDEFSISGGVTVAKARYLTGAM
jgi:hypothetical protein